MKCMLNNKKLIFKFAYPHYPYVTCYNDNCYQINEILSFAVIDLVFKIMIQQERKSIVLKKRKPIIHLLNYIDVLNFNSNSNKLDITFPLENEYEPLLIYNLYLHRGLHRERYYKDLHKNNLKVIEHKNLCIIKLEYDCSTRIQPKNVNLATMLIHILEQKEIDTDLNGIIFYCIFLM